MRARAVLLSPFYRWEQRHKETKLLAHSNKGSRWWSRNLNLSFSGLGSDPNHRAILSWVSPENLFVCYDDSFYFTYIMAGTLPVLCQSCRVFDLKGKQLPELSVE